MNITAATHACVQRRAARQPPASAHRRQSATTGKREVPTTCRPAFIRGPVSATATVASCALAKRPAAEPSTTAWRVRHPPCGPAPADIKRSVAGTAPRESRREEASAARALWADTPQRKLVPRRRSSPRAAREPTAAPWVSCAPAGSAACQAVRGRVPVPGGVPPGQRAGAACFRLTANARCAPPAGLPRRSMGCPSGTRLSAVRVTAGRGPAEVASPASSRGARPSQAPVSPIMAWVRAGAARRAAMAPAVRYSGAGGRAGPPARLGHPCSVTLQRRRSAAVAAPALDALRVLARHVDRLAAVLHLRLRCHPRLDLPGHLHEGILHVGGVLGAGLEEGDVHRAGKLVGRLRLHLALGGEVALVAHEELVDVLRSVPVNLVQPRLDVLEGLRVGHVVHHDDAVGTAVVAARDGAEALLARGVPDLQLDGLAVELDGADLKVHADGRDVRLRVSVVGEAEEEARLAYAAVADEDELEDVVVLLRAARAWRRAGVNSRGRRGGVPGEALPGRALAARDSAARPGTNTGAACAPAAP
eukprot:CAMPEP_0206003608 /NCGR_PEP_ID=MMETSP1464-20131121/3468_1 /ASSEMBLY_ACC=CAM_ASM_001124 /TAXON_ID=119497 /ORGANISM="Exanthemachrysis gayraliae, Strain RCC1523" /LENGTH=533 /DNA_ID=CAMNT_0053376987 /DNA_START=147 /DNA_END=1744 /DNA_ORIENTATION=+